MITLLVTLGCVAGYACVAAWFGGWYYHHRARGSEAELVTFLASVFWCVYLLGYWPYKGLSRLFSLSYHKAKTPRVPPVRVVSK